MTTAPHPPARSELPRRELVPPPEPKELAHLAGRATLTPVAVDDAGDRLEPVGRVERLVRAFGQGLVSAPGADGFPSYVWAHDDEEPDSADEFRLTGRAPGEYAGYRLPPSYWPEGLS